MSILYEAAAKYIKLECSEYRFILSQKRRTTELHINFIDTDFFHLAGLQYITDISIPKNRKKTLNEILFKKSISDTHLSKSKKYQSSIPDKDIKSRISELRFLEEYLDTDNIIKIFNLRNQHISSVINAEYVIESQIKNCSTTVYIFLKRRNESSNYYCIVSFFKKGTVSYGGDKLYWMLKEKITNTSTIEIYKHPSFFY